MRRCGYCGGTIVQLELDGDHTCLLCGRTVGTVTVVGLLHPKQVAAMPTERHCTSCNRTLLVEEFAAAKAGDADCKTCKHCRDLHAVRKRARMSTRTLPLKEGPKHQLRKSWRKELEARTA